MSKTKTDFVAGDRVSVPSSRHKAGFKVGEVIKGPYASSHDKRKRPPKDCFTVGFRRTVCINMGRRWMTKVPPNTRIT